MENDKIKKINSLLYELDKLRLNSPKKTICLAETALMLSEEAEYELGKAVSFLRIANAKADLGEIEASVTMTFNALDYFIKNEFYDLQWQAYNSLGVTFSIIGNYHGSMHYYYKAEAVISNINYNKKFIKNFSSEKAKVLTLNNIAENYKMLHEYTTALNYCRDAYKIDKEKDFSLSHGITALSLGEVYYKLDEYEKANTLAATALTHLKYYNYAIAEAAAYELLALTFWKKGDFLNSDKYYKILIEMLHSQNMPVYNEVNIFINYYMYLKERSKASEAVSALQRAYSLSIKNNMHSKICETSGFLADFYEKSGDMTSAFTYYKIHYKFDLLRLKSFDKQIVKNLNLEKRTHQFENERKEIMKNNENLKKQSEALKLVVKNISIISELGQKITAILDLDSIKTLLFSSIKDFMNLTYFVIGLYNEQTNSIVYIDAFFNGKKIKIPSVSIDDDNNFSVICFKKSKIIIINDLKNEFSKYIDYDAYQKQIKIKTNADINSLIFCPLLFNSAPIGVLSVQSKDKNAFTPYQAEMVKSLSSYAAIAINNALKSMELEKLNKKLINLSENDGLTGIYNRRKFDEYLDRSWHNGILKQERIAMLLIDIDYFKEYNDNYGHLEGDNCIIAVARILDSFESEKYLAARYGGDEFIILLTNSFLEEALILGRNIQSKMALLNIKHEFSKICGRVTLSIGAASAVPYQTGNSIELIKATDKALYTAKKRGRNQISYID